MPLVSTRSFFNPTKQKEGTHGPHIPDVEIEQFELTQVTRTKKRTLDIADAITDAQLERSIDLGGGAGGYTLTVTVNDPEWKIINSGIFDRNENDKLDSIDVQLDGHWLRLVQVAPSDNDLTLTFESRITAWMREHNKPLSVRRKDSTRAEFIYRMIREANRRIPFASTEIHKTQPIKGENKNAVPQTSGSVSLKGGPPGFTRNQRIFAAGVADVTGLDASVIGAWMYKEFGGRSKTTRGNYNFMSVGFTDSGDTAQSMHEVFNDPRSAGEYTGKFILGKTSPRSSSQIQAIAKTAGRSLKTQVHAIINSNWASSHYNYDYSGFLKLAGQFKVSGESASVTVTRKHAYRFTRGSNKQKETSWDAAGRLASEVSWAFWVDKSTIFYESEDTLAKFDPVLSLERTDPEVMSLSFEWDAHKKVPEATLTVIAERWAIPIGACVELVGAGPADGKWIVSGTRRSLYSQETELSLRQPRNEKLEPANETFTSTTDVGADGEGKTGQVIKVQGADRSGVATKQYVIDFLELVAGRMDKTLYVTTGSNHDRLTANGSVSDHWTGEAVDLGSVMNHFAVGGTGGDRIASAAARVMGLKPSEVIGTWTRHYWFHDGKRYSVQVGWKVPDHYDHVHFGVRPAPTPDPQAAPYRPPTGPHAPQNR